jgi:hypothetical protein
VAFVITDENAVRADEGFALGAEQFHRLSVVLAKREDHLMGLVSVSITHSILDGFDNLNGRGRQFVTAKGAFHVQHVGVGLAEGAAEGAEYCCRLFAEATNRFLRGFRSARRTKTGQLELCSVLPQREDVAESDVGLALGNKGNLSAQRAGNRRSARAVAILLPLAGRLKGLESKEQFLSSLDARLAKIVAALQEERVLESFKAQSADGVLRRRHSRIPGTMYVYRFNNLDRCSRGHPMKLIK